MPAWRNAFVRPHIRWGEREALPGDGCRVTFHVKGIICGL